MILRSSGHKFYIYSFNSHIQWDSIRIQGGTQFVYRVGLNSDTARDSIRIQFGLNSDLGDSIVLYRFLYIGC